MVIRKRVCMDEHSWALALVSDVDFLLLDFLNGCSAEELATMMGHRDVD